MNYLTTLIHRERKAQEQQKPTPRSISERVLGRQPVGANPGLEIAISGVFSGIATQMALITFNNVVLRHQAPLQGLNSTALADRMVYVGVVKNSARWSRNTMNRLVPPATHGMGHVPGSVMGGFFGDGIAQVSANMFQNMIGNKTPMSNNVAMIGTSGIAKFMSNYYLRRFVAKVRHYDNIGQCTPTDAGMIGLAAGAVCGAVRAPFVARRTGSWGQTHIIVARTACAIGANYWGYELAWKFLTKRREDEQKK
ncbi:hypothetical protein J8273_2790 [Carpediemonas membranifera]|uniref:Uncharacterized protein n=1 Tax=Carpediemonas membranifera TaxID=201153 RepID=A0A8J6B065_9EUKA|nr:hypothetical protein J8273_2790 [Carpediemonas membranifera]|eukprot:KAG9395595.1 hypothetical protein J8273_2790 [Carpediemonas membranifera]